MSDFKKGDVVQLKSGGPLMTIIADYPSHSHGHSVRCVWFNENKPVEETFVVEALKSV
ncbi:YodC family protein [Fulvimonas yonginensis]|uniref:DUF2158 domain-containing protein n=1 Tax=Fulvimonas yonginensis TaxID=1495200 RepID=A0ABU8JFT0_9GAMM